MLVRELFSRFTRLGEGKALGASDHHGFAVPDVPQGDQAIVNRRCEGLA